MTPEKDRNRAILSPVNTPDQFQVRQRTFIETKTIYSSEYGAVYRLPAAIVVFGDIQGSSKIMDDPSGALNLLEILNRNKDYVLERFPGSYCTTIGDAILTVFPCSSDSQISQELFKRILEVFSQVSAVCSHNIAPMRLSVGFASSDRPITIASITNGPSFLSSPVFADLDRNNHFATPGKTIALTNEMAIRLPPSSTFLDHPDVSSGVQLITAQPLESSSLFPDQVSSGHSVIAHAPIVAMQLNVAPGFIIKDPGTYLTFLSLINQTVENYGATLKPVPGQDGSIKTLFIPNDPAITGPQEAIELCQAIYQVCIAFPELVNNGPVLAVDTSVACHNSSFGDAVGLTSLRACRAGDGYRLAHPNSPPTIILTGQAAKMLFLKQNLPPTEELTFKAWKGEVVILPLASGEFTQVPDLHLVNGNETQFSVLQEIIRAQRSSLVFLGGPPCGQSELAAIAAHSQNTIFQKISLSEKDLLLSRSAVARIIETSQSRSSQDPAVLFIQNSRFLNVDDLNSLQDFVTDRPETPCLIVFDETLSSELIGLQPEIFSIRLERLSPAVVYDIVNAHLAQNNLRLTSSQDALLMRAILNLPQKITAKELWLRLSAANASPGNDFSPWLEEVFSRSSIDALSPGPNQSIFRQLTPNQQRAVALAANLSLCLPNLTVDFFQAVLLLHLGQELSPQEIQQLIACGAVSLGENNPFLYLPPGMVEYCRTVAVTRDQISYLETALKIPNLDPLSEFNLRLTLYRLSGNLKGLISSTKRAIEAATTMSDPAVSYNLYQQLVSSPQVAQLLDLSSSDLYFSLAIAAYHFGRSTEAVAAIDQCLSLTNIQEKIWKPLLKITSKNLNTILAHLRIPNALILTTEGPDLLPRRRKIVKQTKKSLLLLVAFLEKRQSHLESLSPQQLRNTLKYLSNFCRSGLDVYRSPKSLIRFHSMAQKIFDHLKEKGEVSEDSLNQEESNRTYFLIRLAQATADPKNREQHLVAAEKTLINLIATCKLPIPKAFAQENLALVKRLRGDTISAQELFDAAVSTLAAEKQHRDLLVILTEGLKHSIEPSVALRQNPFINRLFLQVKLSFPVN